MINFATGEQLKMNDEKLEMMIRIADKYNYVDLLRECERQMLTILNMNNVKKFVLLATKFKLDCRQLVEKFHKTNLSQNDKERVEKAENESTKS